MRAEHAEGLVADLPAVAVRAVQQVLAPPLADAGDVGELVADAGGDEDRGARSGLRPPASGTVKPGSMSSDPIAR